MIKKSIVAIVVIVATAALVFGASNHINSTGNSDQEQQSVTADNGASDSSASDDTTTETKKISPAEAQKIAQKYIEEPGATTGTPTLSNNVYTVPVMLNGTNVGEIDINAITGKNVGGAGGVSK